MNVQMYVHEDEDKVLQWIHDNYDDGMYYTELQKYEKEQKTH